MLNLLFNAPQNYAWILNYGRRLLEDETKDTEKNRTEHQIHTRIYNNAFCGLLRTGYPFEIIPINNQMFLRLMIDNIPFQCPSNTVSNILRQEYDTIVKPKMDAYNQMESDTSAQREGAELPVIASEQNTGLVPMAEAKPEGVPVPSAEYAPTTSPATEPIPAAGPPQKEVQAVCDDPSPIKAEEAPDDSLAKVTPQKQMEMMRELKSQGTVRRPREDAKNRDVVALQENPIHARPFQDAENNTGDGEEKRKPEQNLRHAIVGAPDLDDIIFAPVVKHKKVVEIGEEPVESAPESPGENQDTENSGMEATEETQKPDMAAPIVEDKKQEDETIPSVESAIDDVKTGQDPKPEDSDESQPEIPVDGETSASHLEFEALMDTMGTGANLDKQGDYKEQRTDSQEPVPSMQQPEELDKKSIPDDTQPKNPGDPSKRMFQPKAQRFAPKAAAPADMNVSDKSEDKSEDSAGQINPKDKKGFLSALFGGGEKKKEAAGIPSASTPAPVVTGESGEDEKEAGTDTPTPAVNAPHTQTDNPSTEAVKKDTLPKTEELPVPEDVKTVSYNHDGGKIFTHIHQAVLKKQFGDSSTGPYRFIFWPLRIIEMQSKKTWADFLVHVTDQNGNETLLCTDGAYKELIVKVDGKEFNVYATWTNGVFDSHVSLYGKTASIYTIEEEVYKEEPEEAEHDTFLDQFRLERKGQPKHFIVPFKNNNRGELNIPIVGCVELGGKRYPLERREENTLRYRYNGSDKVIRGHWEKGVFQFSVDDANRFIWEEHNE